MFLIGKWTCLHGQMLTSPCALFLFCHRKLKNRGAAQPARDRKKEHMSNLEQVVAQLEAENKRLQQENANLRKVTGSLTQENSSLKERLGVEPKVVATEAESMSESAVLKRTPLQKETACSLFLWMTRLMTLLMTYRYVQCLYSNARKHLDETCLQFEL